MADARSLLKSQRESRRINHPHATYTSSGKLLCNLCNTSIKTESLWSNHLRTPDHASRVQRVQKVPAPSQNKKRKANEDDEAEEDEGRKRSKALEPIEPANDEQSISEIAQSKIGIEEAVTQNGAQQQSTIQAAALPADDEDEEWLELQRAIDAAPVPSARGTISAAATISAPAISAEELAAQAREEQSVQRSRRDEEIEGEKEDAARALEDEFQEMEKLEDRVRRLREKREALRKDNKPEDVDVDGPDASTMSEEMRSTSTLADSAASVDTADSAQLYEDDEDDDDDDFDDWKFGGS